MRHERGRRLHASLLILALVVLSSCSGWLEFRAGGDHTGTNPAEQTLGPGAAARLIRQWAATTGGPVDSSPAVAGTTVYVGSADGYLHAYNATSGASLWSAPIGAAVASSPAFSGTTVYVGSADGHLHAYNATSGASLWSAPTGGSISSSPTVLGALVYVGSTDHKVYAFSTTTGALAWSTATGGPVVSSPVASHGLLYVGSDDGKVYALNQTTGTVMWAVATGGAVSSSPAWSGGLVYVGSADHKLYAFDATTGTTRWSVSTGGVVDSSIAADATTIYSAGEDGVLRALDANSGAARWSATLGSGAYSSPALADGVIYLGTRDGRFTAFNAANGTKIWSDQTGAAILSSPAETNGAVYVGSQDGKLYSYVPASPCSPLLNKIACENSRPGSPSSEWDVSGSGDASIQGFATSISVNLGETVHFKINTPATTYHADIYRLGYYGGLGARRIATIRPSVPLPQVQPPCLSDPTTQLLDCGNWSESAAWTVPSTATSGIYFAKLVRDDGTAGSSHVVFVVRDDSSHSDLLYQTSDTTWEAYNSYGGAGIYPTSPSQPRAVKASYNRPFVDRATAARAYSWVFGADEPMVRFMEANGYDVTYASGVDTDRFGSHLLNHRVFLSVGHDEYWSGAQRANVEAARAAGVHLAFFSGNEMYWKMRWENSIDATNTPYRTLVVYKETSSNAKVDPSPVWTGLWRDYRFSPPSDGGRPENALSGTSYVDDPTSHPQLGPLTVSAEQGALRLWRNTDLAQLTPGSSATFGDRVIGYEWDADLDNNARPPGLIDLATSANPDAANFGATTQKPNVTLYRTSSGTLIFSAGTINWSWGLDGHHDNPGSADVRIQQATVNLLADMGVQPTTLQGGLGVASASTDFTSPTSTTTSPATGTSAPAGSPVMVTGTATDTGGHVGGVEISTDTGQSWHPTSGASQWSYTFTPSLAAGPLTLQTRATDDSGNTETPRPGPTLTVTARPCPCTIFGASVPSISDSGSAAPIEVGTKFRSDTSGYITGARFYKSSANSGAHIANLWTAEGTLLSSATFIGETASGWQQVTFPSPVPIAAGILYVISYHSQAGHTANDQWFSTLPYYMFDPTGLDNTPLHMSSSRGPDGPNGVFAPGPSAFPTQPSPMTNYWVDVVFSPT